MSLNIRPGVGERGQRVFNFPISSRGDFGAGSLVVGRTPIDARKFRAVDGKIVAHAQVSAASIQGSIQFYDVTDTDVLLLDDTVDDIQPQTFELQLDLDFTQQRIIEVRAGLDTGPTYVESDILIVWFATVELTTVF